MDSSSNAGEFGVWRALAASLVLHGLLLGPASLPLQVPSRAPTLSATLGSSQARIREQAAPASAELGRPGARAMAASPSIRSPGIATAPPAASASPASASEGTGSSVPASAPAAADFDGLSAYRFGLASAARRYKRYPAVALAGGQAGRVELSLQVDATGSPDSPRVIASSGYPLLDQAAIDMMAQAALATPIPSRLQGAAFAVRLPVEFELERR